MAWRSRSLMIDALSSTDRSVNNGTICGVVICTIRKEKKPIRASVTAAIAAIRAAPSDLMKSKKPCTGLSYPQLAPDLAPYPARFAQFKVSVRLISGGLGGKSHCGCRTNAIAGVLRRRPVRDIGTVLLAILLNARRAQSGKPVLVDRILPGEEFLDRKRIAGAGLFQRQQTATDRGDHLCLAADDPALGCRRWQVRNSQRTSIWPDHIFDPRAMGFGHRYTHKTRLD